MGYILIAQAIRFVIQILGWLIFIDCILSWIPSAKDTKFSKLISKVVDPLVNPIRKLIYKSSIASNLPIDLSPLIAIVILDIISSIL